MAGCKCDHGTVIVDPGGPIPCDDCLYVTSHVVSCDDGVGPCGETGTKVIETNCTDPTFTVIYYDSAFENVSISQIEGAWTITYDTVEGEAVANSYYEIRYKVVCGGGDFDGLSVIGSASICIRNLCKDVVCDGDEVCNPCDGSCGPADINLGLTIK